MIEGIRKGLWKLLIKQPRKPGKNQDAKAPSKEILLFNLATDLGEQKNVAEDHPEIVADLGMRMIELDTEIGPNARKTWQKPK